MLHDTHLVDACGVTLTMLMQITYVMTGRECVELRRQVICDGVDGISVVVVVSSK